MYETCRAILSDLKPEDRSDGTETELAAYEIVRENKRSNNDIGILETIFAKYVESFRDCCNAPKMTRAIG